MTTLEHLLALSDERLADKATEERIGWPLNDGWKGHGYLDAFLALSSPQQ